jgi:hypothetical protein
VSRIFRLALLARDIVESILAGQADQALILERLERPLPASWEEQREQLRSRTGERIRSSTDSTRCFAALRYQRVCPVRLPLAAAIRMHRADLDSCAPRSRSRPAKARGENRVAILGSFAKADALSMIG